MLRNIENTNKAAPRQSLSPGVEGVKESKMKPKKCIRLAATSTPTVPCALCAIDLISQWVTGDSVT